MTKGLVGPKIENISIGSWCPNQNGTGKPEAVSITLTVSDLGDLVVRLKSPERVDEIVDLLLQYKKEVWPNTIVKYGQNKH